LHRAFSNDRRIYGRDEVGRPEPELNCACARSVVTVVTGEGEFTAFVLFSSCGHCALNIIFGRRAQTLK